jgi:hypothetical protein
LKSLGCSKRAAVEWENLLAQHCVGVIYIEEGVAQDVKEVLKWLNLTTNKGWVKSMIHIAAIYTKGLGELKEDYRQAIFWYKKVIEETTKNCGVSLRIIQHHLLYLIVTT